jgi:hypothetical protein
LYTSRLVGTGPDGPLTLVPSYSPENRPANAGQVTVDATMDIAAARHVLTTAPAFHPDHPRAPHCEDPAGAEDLAGVVAPVGQLAAYQLRVGGGHYGQGSGDGGGQDA